MEQLTIPFTKKSIPADLILQLNRFRKKQNYQWYQINFENQSTGQVISLKIYNRWIQISTENYFPNEMDMSHAAFIAGLQKSIEKMLSEA